MFLHAKKNILPAGDHAGGLAMLFEKRDRLLYGSRMVMIKIFQCPPPFTAASALSTRSGLMGSS